MSPVGPAVAEAEAHAGLLVAGRAERRDAQQQLGAAPRPAGRAAQEEAAGAGQAQAAAQGAAHVAPARLVLRHGRARPHRHVGRLVASVPGAAVRGPGHLNAHAPLRGRARDVRDDAPRGPERHLQLHVELVPRGVHFRHVQVHAHLRVLHDGAVGGAQHHDVAVVTADAHFCNGSNGHIGVDVPSSVDKDNNEYSSTTSSVNDNRVRIAVKVAADVIPVHNHDDASVNGHDGAVLPDTSALSAVGPAADDEYAGAVDDTAASATNRGEQRDGRGRAARQHQRVRLPAGRAVRQLLGAVRLRGRRLPLLLLAGQPVRGAHALRARRPGGRHRALLCHPIRADGGHGRHPVRHALRLPLRGGPESAPPPPPSPSPPHGTANGGQQRLLDQHSGGHAGRADVRRCGAEAPLTPRGHDGQPHHDVAQQLATAG